MMDANTDLKAIGRKGQKLTLRNDFTGCSIVEKLASQSLCCFPAVALKPVFNSTQYNIYKSGNLVDQWLDYCTITSI